jgi:chromosomal replication initiator protein
MKFNKTEKKDLKKIINVNLTKEEVLRVVAEECQISVESMSEKTRKQEVVEGRHMFCALVKYHMRLTLKNIGQSIGDRDHTTVIHALRTFNERMDNEDFYRERVMKIHERLGLSYEDFYRETVMKLEEKLGIS